MKLLSVDTSSEVCSVALLEDNKLIKELNKMNFKTHSENLMPLIDCIFNKTGLSLSDIDAIACGIGPGSFTGIRIGIATCKAMAEVKHLPLIGVTSLETLAYLEAATENVIISIIDAKNNQVYAGVFDANHIQLLDYMADDINNILPYLTSYNSAILIGNGAILHKEKIQSCLNNVIFSKNSTQSSFALGKCAYQKWLRKEILTPDTLLPLYLRKSQAERMKHSNELPN